MTLTEIGDELEAKSGQDESTPTELARPSRAGDTAITKNSGNALYRLILRMHFYAGILVAPFLLIAGISGALYAASPSVEKVLYHSQTTAASAEVNVPLAQQISTARTVYPDLKMSFVVAGSGGENTRVQFADPSLPDKSYTRVVFIDPSSGEIRGQLTSLGGSLALPVRGWLSEFHRNLHLGDPGRLYIELAASWLVPLALGGLYLWWRSRRRQGASLFFSRKHQRSRSRRQRARSQHAIVGTWIIIGLLIVAFTGLAWSSLAGENVDKVRAELGWTNPKVSAKDGQHHAPQAPGDVDRALALVHEAGLTDPIRLIPPKNEEEIWTAREVTRSWHPGPSLAAVDPQAGKIVEHIDFREYPFVAKVLNWGIRMHMGFLFGLLNQILQFILASALVFIVIRGYQMWWLRRPTRGRGMGRPPQRGALWQAVRNRPVVATLCTIALCAVGWFVPLFGASLLVFLVIDAIIGLIAYKRGKAKATGAAV